MTDRFRDRLSEYIDGELESSEEALVERHLETCTECAGVLGDLEAVRSRAGELPERQPEADLWAGIARRIEADEKRPTVDAAPASRRIRRVALTVPQLAAAAVAIASLSTTGAWMALAGPDGAVPTDGTSAPAEAAGASLVATGPETVRPLADRYGSVIAELEGALFSSPNRLDPETEASLRRALLKLDRAIEDAVRALEKLPGDPYLEQHVESTMRRKAEFLERAVRLSQS